MASKSKSNRRPDHQDEQEPLTEMADTARKNYEQAIRTGQKFQEEASQWWARMLTQTAGAAEWQRSFAKFGTLAGNVMPMAQKCMGEAMEMMQKTGRTSAELAKKAVEAAQTPTLAESQAKWIEFWTSSMKAAQANVEAATQMGTSTIDYWIEFVRKNADFTESQTSRVA